MSADRSCTTSIGATKSGVSGKAVEDNQRGALRSKAIAELIGIFGACALCPRIIERGDRLGLVDIELERAARKIRPKTVLRFAASIPDINVARI